MAASNRKCRLELAQIIRKCQKAYNWKPRNIMMPCNPMFSLPLFSVLLNVYFLKGLPSLLTATWEPVAAGAAYLPVCFQQERKKRLSL